MVIINFHVHIDESEDANANGILVKMGRKEILKHMDESLVFSKNRFRILPINS